MSSIGLISILLTLFSLFINWGLILMKMDTLAGQKLMKKKEKNNKKNWI